MRRRGWIAGVVAVAIATAGAWVSIRLLNPQPIWFGAGDLTAIQLQPVPEGPTIDFTLSPLHGSWGGGNLPLSSVASAIPVPLPAPQFQGFCREGGDLIVSLRDGRRVIYGPCHHPASIRALWRQMELVASRGRCQQACAPDQ